jgi:phosphate-selective porin OprO/OprP
MERQDNMKNTWFKTFAGAGMVAALFIGSAAHADYNKLVDTLAAKGTITADEAEGLKAQTLIPDNKWLDKLEIRGRVHAQFAYVDAKNDAGSGDWSTLELRRARFGATGDFPGKLRGHIEGNILPGEASLRAAYVSWREHKTMNVTAGYDKPRTSLEENWSSSKIKTVERSNVNNTIAAPGETVGVWLSGDLAPFYYNVGVYNDEDATRNSSNVEAKYLFNARGGVNLELAEDTDLELAVTYLSSDDPNGNVGGDFEEIAVFSAQAELGAAGFLAEYMMGSTPADGDTDGFAILGWLELSDKLEAVARYETVSSDDASGVRATSRYGRRTDTVVTGVDADGDDVVADKGDDFSAIYVGLNYYMNSHGQKVMLGLEMNELDGTSAGTYETTTLFAAWRTRF